MMATFSARVGKVNQSLTAIPLNRSDLSCRARAIPSGDRSAGFLGCSVGKTGANRAQSQKCRASNSKSDLPSATSIANDKLRELEKARAEKFGLKEEDFEREPLIQDLLVNMPTIDQSDPIPWMQSRQQLYLLTGALFAVPIVAEIVLENVFHIEQIFAQAYTVFGFTFVIMAFWMKQYFIRSKDKKLNANIQRQLYDRQWVENQMWDMPFEDLQKLHETVPKLSRDLGELEFMMLVKGLEGIENVNDMLLILCPGEDDEETAKEVNRQRVLTPAQQEIEQNRRAAEVARLLGKDLPSTE